MTEEEAIKVCKKIIQQNNEIVKQTRANRDINGMQLTANCDKESIAIETLLNLIQKQQAELLAQEREIEKKDKIIDKLVPRIYLTQKEREIMKKYIWDSNKLKGFSSFVKQYFERKLEESEDKQC